MAAIEARLPPVSVSQSKSWYAVNAKAGTNEAEISIYDEIGGWGITAGQFAEDLKAITAGRINVRINSPGGEVTEGTAIHNAIRRHPAHVTVYVDGLAASAGSVIAMSGDEIRMADNAYLMIHEARGGVMGEAGDMRLYADLLDKMNDTIAESYARQSGKPKEHYREMMAAETWYTAVEAKAEGLVDEVYDTSKASGSASASAKAFDFKIYNKVPAAAIAAWNQSQQKPELPPEDSSRDEPPPAIQKEAIMADNDTTAAAAQTVAAPSELVRLTDSAVADFIVKGKMVGRAEGRQALMDDIRAMVAACPSRPQTVLNAVLGGQSVSTLKLIVDAEVNAEIAANKRAGEQDIEIAKLRAEQARLMELSAIGGHPGVSASVYAPSRSTQAESRAGLEPEAQAQLEWDGDPMLRANNGGDAGKKRWMLFRVNQLNGSIRILKTA